MKKRSAAVWSSCLFTLALLVFGVSDTRGADRALSPHDRLIKVLQLTPAQLVEWKAAFRPLDALAADKSMARKERFQKMAVEGHKVRQRLQEILTPVQEQIYLKHRQERAQTAATIKQERERRGISQRMNVVPRSLRGSNSGASGGNTQN